MFAALPGKTDCWAVVQVYMSTVMSLESMIGFSMLNSVSKGMFNYSRFSFTSSSAYSLSESANAEDWVHCCIGRMYVSIH